MFCAKHRCAVSCAVPQGQQQAFVVLVHCLCFGRGWKCFCSVHKRVLRAQASEVVSAFGLLVFQILKKCSMGYEKSDKVATVNWNTKTNEPEEPFEWVYPNVVYPNVEQTFRKHCAVTPFMELAGISKRIMPGFVFSSVWPTQSVLGQDGMYLFSLRWLLATEHFTTSLTALFWRNCLTTTLLTLHAARRHQRFTPPVPRNNNASTRYIPAFDP